jgi:peptidoglycan/LPS O-acetylase OafA/YrhL
MVSFSVYLVHLPVIEWIRRAMWDYPKPGQVAVILLLTLAISTCTYLAIERPFVLLGSRLSRRILGS